MLPTFFVIGAMKAGTTSLYEYLSRHPDVFACTPKEPNFFSVPSIWSRGSSWYEAFFEGAGSATARGDFSTSYTMADKYPDVPARVAQVVPEARFVYLVRHPLERMKSMYVHHVFQGRERRRIYAAFRTDPHYLATSRYAWQLDRYLEHFPREHILVVAAERLRDRREAAMRRILQFIGVDDEYVPDNLEVEYHPTAPKWIPRRGLWGAGTWVERPLWPPDQRARLARRLLTRRLRAGDVTLAPDLELSLWRELGEDLARLEALVGSDEYAMWGWCHA